MLDAITPVPWSGETTEQMVEVYLDLARRGLCRIYTAPDIVYTLTFAAPKVWRLRLYHRTSLFRVSMKLKELLATVGSDEIRRVELATPVKTLGRLAGRAGMRFEGIEYASYWNGTELVDQYRYGVTTWVAVSVAS